MRGMMKFGLWKISFEEKNFADHFFLRNFLSVSPNSQYHFPSRQEGKSNFSPRHLQQELCLQFMFSKPLRFTINGLRLMEFHNKQTLHKTQFGAAGLPSPSNFSHFHSARCHNKDATKSRSHNSCNNTTPVLPILRILNTTNACKQRKYMRHF